MTSSFGKLFLFSSLFLLNFLFVRAQTEYIVIVDPSNGNIAKINSIPGVRYLQGYSAYNQASKEYTVIGTWEPGTLLNYLYTLDAGTGNILLQPHLSLNNVACFQYSRSTGILYGIVYTNGMYHLAAINKESGTSSLIHDLPGIDGVVSFTIDEENNRLFMRVVDIVDYNSSFAIYCIDLLTGNILSHVSTPDLECLQYDNVAHKLYALKFRPSSDPNTNILSICTVDPFSGIITAIADLPGVTGIISGYETFNENDHIFYFTGAEPSNPGTIYLYSVDVVSGIIINRVPIPSSGTAENDNLIYFRYDNISGKMYALLWEAHTIGSVPVTLSTFGATFQEQSVKCKWQTFQEINSSRFIIERSDDGINFISVGYVTATGNSSLTNDYTFIDKAPSLSDKEYLFYRLKIIDNDGRFTYSSIVKVSLKYGLLLRIFPNPVSNQLSFNFISPFNEKASISITDIAGRALLKKNISIKKGSNSFSFNISHFPCGAYTLFLTSSNKFSGKFFKIQD